MKKDCARCLFPVAMRNLFAYGRFVDTWGANKMDNDYDAYIKQAMAQEATFAEADRVARMEKQARNDAEYEANRAAVLKQSPWPTDPTALRGHRMGLQEFIRERGD